MTTMPVIASSTPQRAPFAGRRRSAMRPRAAAVEEVLQAGAPDARPTVPAGLNKFSARITQPKSQGASQAMLFGTGLTEEDMSKPQVRAAYADHNAAARLGFALLSAPAARGGRRRRLAAASSSPRPQFNSPPPLPPRHLLPHPPPPRRPPARPQVGISSVWWEGNTCNMHLNDLAAEVKAGVVDVGLVGMRFNTIGVSDGISMGTDGMSYSLQSRDLIADSIETVMGAQWCVGLLLILLLLNCLFVYFYIICIYFLNYIYYLLYTTSPRWGLHLPISACPRRTRRQSHPIHPPNSPPITHPPPTSPRYDANISLPGCDKNMPGALIAMARLNRPALMIYGGTIRAGHSPAAPGEPLDIVSAFQSYGGYAAGLIDEAARADIVRHSCPGAGACGGMYTANTMASAIEALGMALPYSSCTPAEDPMKMVECRLAGRYVLELMKRDIKPRDVMTRAAFENAMVLIMATGGSTNAVLHLLAMARAAGVELSLDDFQRVSDRTPFLCDLKPSGKYVMEDLHAVSWWWWRAWFGWCCSVIAYYLPFIYIYNSFICIVVLLLYYSYNRRCARSGERRRAPLGAPPARRPGRGRARRDSDPPAADKRARAPPPWRAALCTRCTLFFNLKSPPLSPHPTTTLPGRRHARRPQVPCRAQLPRHVRAHRDRPLARREPRRLPAAQGWPGRGPPRRDAH
jgi:hypothetical protein